MQSFLLALLLRFTSFVVFVPTSGGGAEVQPPIDEDFVVIDSSSSTHALQESDSPARFLPAGGGFLLAEVVEVVAGGRRVKTRGAPNKTNHA